MCAGPTFLRSRDLPASGGLKICGSQDYSSVTLSLEHVSFGRGFSLAEESSKILCLSLKRGSGPCPKTAPLFHF